MSTVASLSLSSIRLSLSLYLPRSIARNFSLGREEVKGSALEKATRPGGSLLTFAPDDFDRVSRVLHRSSLLLAVLRIESSEVSKMAKDRRDRSTSFDRYRTSPYSSSSKRPKLSSPKVSSSKPDENIKEFEDARCPVCMEHPHNAILLICSSHDKGCRPYMCDTSYRHSNCFDQFRKSFEQQPSASPPEEASIRGSTEVVVNSESATVSSSAGTGSISCDNKVPPELMCPLCRGHIKTWVVLEPARSFMNSKSRSCASEACEFSGTYSDLRKHARHEHPLVRPSEADPERQRNWRRLERQRDMGDLLSTLQSSFGEERVVHDDDSSDIMMPPIDDGSFLTVFFLIRVFRPGVMGSGSRSRASSRARRRSTAAREALFGEPRDDEETVSSSRDAENNNDDDSDGGSVHLRQSERIQRQQRTPDSDGGSVPSRQSERIRRQRRTPDSS
ncbi:unnamed protein product [Linum tenue]|uniref:Uncharacterized protein n=1 Tax=Linum tenue TaxID=586396 RepID=A0AAV0HWE2_9ROSI|nr:unnamed protein product [Linum tenue]